MTTLDKNTVEFDEPDYSESIFIENSEMTESLTSLDRLGDFWVDQLFILKLKHLSTLLLRLARGIS